MPSITERVMYRGRHAVHRVDRALGRALFANTLPFSFNAGGPLRELRARTLAWPRIARRRTPEVMALRKQGFVILPDAHDPTLIAAIKSRFDALIEDEGHSVSRSPGGLPAVFSRSLNFPLQNIPEITQLLSPDVDRLLRSYYGAHYRVVMVKAFRNRHVQDAVLKTHDVLSNTWHFDTNYTDACDYWVPLTDVGDDDGPTHLHTIRSSKAVMRMGFGTRSDYRLPLGVLEDPTRIHRFTGNAGTKILHRHPMTLHRAGIPAPDHYRDTILFRIEPAAKPLSRGWFREVEAERPTNKTRRKGG